MPVRCNRILSRSAGLLVSVSLLVAAAPASNPRQGFGYSVARAGDVNGDGYDDIIVGAPYYEAGETSEGAAFLFLGSASGISNGTPATAAARFESNQASAQLGSSVAAAGDVNGDGYDDIIVGAPYYDAGETNEGAAFLFLGSASGISNGSPATAAARFESNQVSAQLGSSVAAAGDVNGDGYDDIIVGAPYYDAGQIDEGAAFLFLGSASGITNGSPATAAARFESNQAQASLGLSVATAGDVGGDGYDDIIVGAPGYDAGETDEGAAFLFLGSASGISNGSPATAAARFESNQASAQLGYSVAAAGDVNGDRYDDIIVGALSLFDINSVRSALIFFGSPTGIASGSSTTADAVLEPDEYGGYFGLSVSSAGDVNADGYDDVIVGSPFNSFGPAFVFLGDAAALDSGSPVTPSLRLMANNVNSSYGWPVARAGDVNADGFGDLIVGDHFSDTSYVFSGLICSGTDEDGDGIPDYIPWACESAAVLSVTACDNRRDDDGDGLADYPADSGCISFLDNSEHEGGVVCDDGIDNDSDGLSDYPSDTGCASALDGSEWSSVACDNGIDDDGDGRTDKRSDPGCDSLVDTSELGSAACDNGLDDDGDGLTDYGRDANCVSLVDGSEQPVACDNGIDDDHDGKIDFGTGASTDPGCGNANDASELSSLACDNGIDDDGDTRVDWRPDATGDPECFSLKDTSEIAQTSREPWRCGIGPELALLVPALVALRHRRRES